MGWVATGRLSFFLHSVCECYDFRGTVASWQLHCPQCFAISGVVKTMVLWKCCDHYECGSSNFVPCEPDSPRYFRWVRLGCTKVQTFSKADIQLEILRNRDQFIDFSIYGPGALKLQLSCRKRVSFYRDLVFSRGIHSARRKNTLEDRCDCKALYYIS